MSLVGCSPWGGTEPDMAEATQHTCVKGLKNASTLCVRRSQSEKDRDRSLEESVQLEFIRKSARTDNSTEGTPQRSVEGPSQVSADYCSSHTLKEITLF